MRLENRDRGVTQDPQLLDFHLCTPEELDEFYPPAQSASALVERYKQDNTSLFCLNDWSSLSLSGDINTKNMMINLVVEPCNVGLELGATPEDNPECITDLNEQETLLNPLQVVFYHN